MALLPSAQGNLQQTRHTGVNFRITYLLKHRRRRAIANRVTRYLYFTSKR